MQMIIPRLTGAVHVLLAHLEPSASSRVYMETDVTGSIKVACPL